MHVTLQDVAKLAGVSTKTVSRVVNNQSEISQATRRRVQAAIEQLGYRPNILARSLVNKRSDTLAVVAWGLEFYGGPQRVLVGVEQQVFELGYSMLFSLLPRPDDTNIYPVLDAFVDRRVDGIVWALPEIGDNHKWARPERLKSLPPIVFVSMEPRPGLSVVAIDNRAGAAQAVRHLIDQGRRKIGVITGPMTWWESRERYEGWRDILQCTGLDASPSLVVEGDWSAASGAQAIRQLLKQRPDIDSVFASNDQMALGALGVMHSLGRNIPRDIAMVGFDDVPEAGFYWPPLTTVFQQLTEVGRIAVQILHKLIQARQQGQDNAEASSTLLTPQLVVRASSA